MFSAKRTPKRDLNVTEVAEPSVESVRPKVYSDEPNTLPKEVVDIMNVISNDWDFMTEEDFNPIPHALSLLDTSSLGLNYTKFGKIYEKLETAMDLIVNDYHQAFNTAIQTFSSVVENISEWLQCKRFDLLHLWVKSIQYKEMNRILDLIDELQKTPEKLETLIHGKFYLTAVRTLISTLRTLNGDDLCEIGALESIRSKLEDLKNIIPESLLEELHNHIYLKSPFSLDRIGKGVDCGKTPKSATEGLNGLKLSSFAKISEDLDLNPESDSFSYMKTLLESLFIIGRLPDAIEIVRERLPVEVYYVVERTIQEVDGSTKADQASLLRDLLSNLFVKLEAIIDGHKFIASFVNSKALNFEMYSERDVWLTIQNEVKALLYDYLTNSSRTSTFANAVVSMNEILKEKRTIKRGQKTRKQIFRITGSTLPDNLEKEYKDIINSSASTTIGLGSAVGGENNSLGGLSIGIIDKYANVVAAGHRLLVRPDPYNVLLAFKPTIAFSEKIETSIEFRSGNFKIFLEEFILNVFLPQMEERVLEYFHNFVNGSDAFLTETSPDIAGYPLLKSSIALIVLIQGMCRTLYAIPVHQNEFIKMIEMVLVKYYEKCLNRFRALMSGDQTGREYEGVGIISADTRPRNQSIVITKEMKLKKERSFHRNELIFEPRKLKALASMHYSLVSQLRMTDKIRRRIPTLRSLKASEKSTTSVENYTKWSTDSLPALPFDTEDDVQLPLNVEMGSRFDSILNYYQELSETYLFTLRVELRCHSMFYLDLAMREVGNYNLADEPGEPDPYVSLLNEDLINVEEGVNNALPTRRIRFLFDGLSSLITHTLCSNLRYVKQVNHFGVLKLLRNVQSIQHCLTNIAAIHEKGLDRARDYFTLLGFSAEELYTFMNANPGKFTYDEYIVILDLTFQPLLADDAPGARKQYQLYVEKIKAFFVNSK
ncbi:hypothetical protein HDU67_007981 [Dinochytrium kinnereticum]|nr:hypothetical protein HDU67_007981 [Dinochytrium kinnereticum]